MREFIQDTQPSDVSLFKKVQRLRGSLCGVVSLHSGDASLSGGPSRCARRAARHETRVCISMHIRFTGTCTETDGREWASFERWQSLANTGAVSGERLNRHIYIPEGNAVARASLELCKAVDSLAYCTQEGSWQHVVQRAPPWQARLPPPPTEGAALLGGHPSHRHSERSRERRVVSAADARRATERQRRWGRLDELQRRLGPLRTHAHLGQPSTHPPQVDEQPATRA